MWWICAWTKKHSTFGAALSADVNMISEARKKEDSEFIEDLFPLLLLYLYPPVPLLPLFTAAMWILADHLLRRKVPPRKASRAKVPPRKASRAKVPLRKVPLRPNNSVKAAGESDLTLAASPPVTCLFCLCLHRIKSRQHYKDYSLDLCLCVSVCVSGRSSTKWTSGTLRPGRSRRIITRNSGKKTQRPRNKTPKTNSTRLLKTCLICGGNVHRNTLYIITGTYWRPR